LIPPKNAGVERLLEALAVYRAARNEFMSALGCPTSNRDPFAEFSERVALAALGGTMAQSRTQKGWDFMDADGRRVQVRYLANPAGRWVNEHVVDFRGGGCDRYALLIFEAFDAKTLLVFEHEGIAELCRALGKRHVDQADALGLTQRNYQTIVSAPERFAGLGVQVLNLGASG
jgi:hypothetical protein